MLLFLRVAELDNPAVVCCVRLLDFDLNHELIFFVINLAFALKVSYV